jgi:hypothetical protein
MKPTCRLDDRSSDRGYHSTHTLHLYGSRSGKESAQGEIIILDHKDSELEFDRRVRNDSHLCDNDAPMKPHNRR